MWLIPLGQAILTHLTRTLIVPFEQYSHVFYHYYDYMSNYHVCHSTFCFLQTTTASYIHAVMS